MSTTPHDYFICYPDTEDADHCLVDEWPRPLKKTSWPLSEGTRMGEKFPAGVRLNMARSHRGIFVPDAIPNTLLVYMISGRLKALLEKEAGVEIEFLPFTLYNHKGRIAAEDCFIANVIGTRDCVDMKRTRGEKSIMSPGEFEAIFLLHLDPPRIPPEEKLFRLNVRPNIFIIRDDLRATFEQHGITGIRYIAMGERCRVL